MSETTGKMPDPALLAEANPDPNHWRGQADRLAATLYEIRVEAIRAGIHDEPVGTLGMVRELRRQLDAEREAHRITKTELEQHVGALDYIRDTCERAGIPSETTDEQGITRRWSAPHLVERLAEQLALVDKMLVDQIRAAAWPHRGDRQTAPESPTTQAGTGSEGDRLGVSIDHGKGEPISVVWHADIRGLRVELDRQATEQQTPDLLTRIRQAVQAAIEGGSHVAAAKLLELEARLEHRV